MNEGRKSDEGQGKGGGEHCGNDVKIENSRDADQWNEGAREEWEAEGRMRLRCQLSFCDYGWSGWERDGPTSEFEGIQTWLAKTNKR